MTDEQETDGEEAQALAANARAVAEGQYLQAQMARGAIGGLSYQRAQDQAVRLECLKLADRDLALAQKMFNFVNGLNEAR